jgi:hypothetical protein
MAKQDFLHGCGHFVPLFILHCKVQELIMVVGGNARCVACLEKLNDSQWCGDHAAFTEACLHSLHEAYTVYLEPQLDVLGNRDRHCCHSCCFALYCMLDMQLQAC